MKISDATIRSLKSTDKQVMYRDDTLPGFGVRVTPKGIRSFCLMHGSQRTITTIGRYPVISLAEARDAAKRILAQKTLGTYQPRTIRFSDALDLFVETHCAAIKTGYEYERLLRREFLPSLKGKTLDKITPHDIAPIIDKLAHSIAYHAFNYLRALFTWAVNRSYLDHSPLYKMQRPKKSNARERVLTDDELRRVWTAAGEMGSYGTIVKLLMLTGQRRGEIATLKYDYIQGETITLPTTKNGHPHRFPIGPLSLSLLSTAIAARDTNCGAKTSGQQELFPTRRTATNCISGWGNYKRALNENCGFSDFTHHDLRRTFATRLAEMGVAPHVIERLLNHVTGSLSPIARIYNRASYEKECRDAIGLWEAHLTKILR